MLKFLFVLPLSFKEIEGKIRELIYREFSYIQDEYLIYDTYESAVAQLADNQQTYDSIFFAGPYIYNYMISRLRQLNHWSVFPRSSNTMLRAISKAALSGWDILRLSIDTYSKHAVAEAYQELSIREDTLALPVYNDMDDMDFTQNALQYHLENLKAGKASGIITVSSGVVSELEKRRIPYIAAVPTLDTIWETLFNTVQYHRAQKNILGQIAVIYININFPPEHSLLLSDEYSFMLEKMKIIKEVYKYADRLSASVAEESIYNFILFSTYGALDLETAHFRKFELLNWLERVTCYSVSIGLGNGETAIDARHNAFRAMLRAKNHEQNAAYVLINGQEPMGPYLGDTVQKQPEDLPEEFQRIMSKTNISSNTIHRLYTWVLKENIDFFTSKELADGLKMSKRSADRLIEKLLSADLAVLSTEQIKGERGRPTRIIRLNLPKFES